MPTPNNRDAADKCGSLDIANPVSDEARISFSIRFDHPVVIWVLQLGGWLPLPLTSVGVVLVDKNVLGAIEALEANPDREDMAVERWWLSHLNSERFALNTVLCAHEGDTMSIPIYSEFCDTLARYTGSLARNLPKARLVEHCTSDLDRLFENVTATVERQARETRFLLEVAPQLSHRASAVRAPELEKRVVAAARDFDLNLQTFVVLSALSCLYERQDGSEPMIGRGVLKPRSDYSSKDAHNAISDLRSLEMLAMAAGIDGPSIGYCTRDKDLAALWTNLRVSEPRWVGNTFSATVSPAQEIFPRLDAEAVGKLLSRLR